MTGSALSKIDTMPELTTEQKTERGENLAKVLRLKIARDDNGERYKPERYETTWLNKTALGLFESVARIMEGEQP